VIIGLDASSGSWATDVKGCVGTVRVNQTEHAGSFGSMWTAGLKTLVLFGGPYNGGGVKGLNPTTWANNALNWYVANTSPSASPIIEILNEPYGEWFWSSSRDRAATRSQSNADAYAVLLKTTWQVFHNHYGSSAPLVLASYEDDDWGGKWVHTSAVSGILGFVDGVTVHSYGGSTGQNGGANGDRSKVTNAHSKTGKNVYVTEMGWPTAVGQPPTGDSQQWPESSQASNITNFAAWANQQGWVACWIYFCYRDFGTNDWYGVTRTNGTRKPSYSALHTAFQTYDTGVVTPPASPLTVQVNPSNPAQFQIVAVPTGTQRVHVAFAQDTGGTNITFPGLATPGDVVGTGSPPTTFSLPVNITPPADHPAVQAIAWSTTDPNTEQDLSTWSDWVLTTPSSAGTVPTATTDAASSVTANSAVLNGHGDAHGVSGATFQFNLAPSVNGVRGAVTQLPSPPVLVGDVASTLAYAAVQSGTVNAGTSINVGATGFTDGRFLLAIVEAKGISQTQTTITPGSGYTLITGGDQTFTNSSNGAHRLSIYKKVASSEAATTWTFSQSSNHSVTILAFDGVDTTTPLEEQDAVSHALAKFSVNAASASMNVPSALANSGEIMVYGGALTNGESVTFPTTTPTTTERTDIQTGATATDCTLFAGTQPVTSTGLQGTRTITATTVNAVDTSCCFAVVLKGTTGGGTTNKAVSWTAPGLTPGAYQYQLAVTAGGLTNLGQWVTFNIAGQPVVSSLGVTDVTDVTADVTAHIDPLGVSTTWRIETSTDGGVTWTTAIPDSAPFTTPVDI
jgi:hypothetical protein